MITYIDTGKTVSLRGLSIPKDPGNRHYAEFLELQARDEAQLVAPSASLDDRIASKSAAIQTAKCRIRDAGYDVNGVHFDSDHAARTAYLELAMEIAADPAYSTDWKASPGKWVTMNAALFAAVKTAGAEHMAAVFGWQAARDAELASIRAAVDAGTMTEANALAAVDAVSATYPI